MSPAKNNSNDNFNFEEQFKASADDYLKPDNFGKFFKEAAEKSKDVDSAIKSVLKQLLKQDTETREDIKKLISDFYREDVKKQISLFVKGVWQITLLIIGGGITVAIQFLLKFLSK